MTKLREIQRDIVSAVIFSKDGKILFGKKDPMKGGVYIDCWHIPGGGIDEGEDKIEALIREIKEEVGLSINENQISEVKYRGKGVSERKMEDGERVLCHMNFFTYKVELDIDSDLFELKPTSDLIEFMWVKPENLKDFKLTPPSIELFTKLGYL